MWRWSCAGRAWSQYCWVFSTYVEVIPVTPSAPLSISSILHVCGGDPMPLVMMPNGVNVFSTYVEVILSAIDGSIIGWCILHVCGGDPRCAVGHRDHVWYSPRMWRWSLIILNKYTTVRVFSTYVEVILTDLVGAVLDWGILHTCWECYCPWAHR